MIKVKGSNQKWISKEEPKGMSLTMNEEKRIYTPKERVLSKRDVFVFILLGIVLGINIILGFFLYENRVEFFNFSIDFSRSIELGILIMKFMVIIAVLIVDLKLLNKVIKTYQKYTVTQEKKVKEGDAKENFKRMGIIKKIRFKWIMGEARRWMDKYHENFSKLQKIIGRIKGDETKDLIKAKEEMIKGILLWTEDFAIPVLEKNSKGEWEYTNIPVTKEFLEGLYMDELYELYLTRCVDTSNEFINGVKPDEKMELI